MDEPSQKAAGRADHRVVEIDDLQFGCGGPIPEAEALRQQGRPVVEGRCPAVDRGHGNRSRGQHCLPP